MHLRQSALIMTALFFLAIFLPGCGLSRHETERQRQQQYYREQYEAALRDFQTKQDAYNTSLQEAYQAYADNLSQHFQQQYENEQLLLERQIQQAQQQQ